MACLLVNPVIIPANLFRGSEAYQSLKDSFKYKTLVSIVEPYAANRPETYSKAKSCFDEQQELCKTLQQSYNVRAFRLAGFSSEMIPSGELYNELVGCEIRNYMEKEVKGRLDQLIKTAESEKTKIVGIGGLDPGRVVPESDDSAEWIAADTQTNFFLYQVRYALANNLPAVINLQANNKRLKDYIDPLSATLDLLELEFNGGEEDRELIERGKLLFREISGFSDLNRALEKGFYAQLTTNPQLLEAEADKPELSWEEKAVFIIQETMKSRPDYAKRIVSGTGFMCNGNYQEFLKFNRLLKERLGEEMSDLILGKSIVDFFDLEKIFREKYLRRKY